MGSVLSVRIALATTIVVITTLIVAPVPRIVSYDLCMMTLRRVMEIESNVCGPTQIMAPATRGIAPGDPDVAIDVNVFSASVVVIDFIARVINVTILNDYLRGS